MAESVLAQVQAAQTGFLRSVHGVTLSDKVCTFEILKTMNVEPIPLRFKRSQQLCLFGHVSRLVPGTIGEWGTSCWLQPRESGPEVVQGPGGVNASPNLLGPILVWSQ